MIWCEWATKKQRNYIHVASFLRVHLSNILNKISMQSLGLEKMNKHVLRSEEKWLCPQIDCSKSAPKFKGSVSFISFISFIFFIWTATMVSLAVKTPAAPWTCLRPHLGELWFCRSRLDPQTRWNHPDLGLCPTGPPNSLSQSDQTRAVA
jgi:hypothetical protein